MQELSAAFWKNKRVFLTGHTGFKGGWLSLWLQSLGAEVHGLSLDPPTDPALYFVADVQDQMYSVNGDIRNYQFVLQAISASRPDIIFHMAAQPLVRRSYDAPLETYETNVMGTLHVFEAARAVGTTKAIVNVTTDKCYENKEWEWGYRENEPMGGYDPYSNSKGCAELVTTAYRRSFFTDTNLALASARSGNVIGGGDWATDRLVPDILRAFEDLRPVIIRNPHSIRPWQHVLEPLSGYLLLAQSLYREGQCFAEGWNFGPNDDDARSVQWIVDRMVGQWGGSAEWQLDGGCNPHEATSLKLDISKAKTRLGWRPRWDLSTALDKTIEWHRAWRSNSDMRAECLKQIVEYQNSKI